MALPTTNGFEPRIDHLYGSGDGPCYWDGYVLGAVNQYDLPYGRKGIVIHEWSSEHPGQGHTTRALQWLRERFDVICANGVGSIEEIDGELVGDIATGYWQHVRSKGLVDVLLDDDGNELDADNRVVEAASLPM